MNLNKVFILGNVTQDPQIRQLPDGTLVANFGLATNRIYNDQAGERRQQTEFHNVVAFGRNAEIVQQYVQKGNLLLIEGRLQTRNWEDPSGARKYKTEIITERLQLGPKSIQTSGERGIVEDKNTAEDEKEEIPIVEEDDKTTDSKNKNDEEEEEINLDDIPL